jgi:hypothetical protein
MKLVIQTQHKENYGAHDWDGTGECPQYWKFKGGNTYVVERILPKQAVKIIDGGIPTLTLLIESKDEYFEEYITSWETMNDSAVVCEEWDSPIVLNFDSVTRLWEAVRIYDNSRDMGYMRKEILKKTESWTMGPDGERKDYGQTFLMEDGKTVNYSGLQQWFNNMEEVA